MTTRQEIGNWFDTGVEQNATHMIVMCDTFDYEDYPVYVKDGENPRTVASEHQTGGMQTVMECYDLRLDKNEQLSEHRAQHWTVNPSFVDVPPEQRPGIDETWDRAERNHGEGWSLIEDGQPPTNPSKHWFFVMDHGTFIGSYKSEKQARELRASRRALMLEKQRPYVKLYRAVEVK